ncbi:cytochrome P450 315a1, mitochondrial-like isoform X2 [Euwallacea similis]|uniref:cytochrome P450 315a1, mitochondrial-like isoform X2 n=1 Tax=Euwallacea similis TaxID=1736056 RepID=UPI003450F3AB
MACTSCNLLRKSLSAITSPLGVIRTEYSISSMKNFADIPSARGLPLIGTTLSLLMAGSAPKLHKYIDKRHKQLGPIFKESIGPVPCVFISEPEAMRLVYAHEGKYPVHLLPEAWTTYNTLYNVSRGLFFMNGPEWLHFRKILNPLLLKGDQGWLEECCRPAIESLVEDLGTERNMEEMLYKWSLEVMVSVLVGVSKYRDVRDGLNLKMTNLASKINRVFEDSAKLSLISAKFAAKYRIYRWRRFEASVTAALRSAADLVDLLSQNQLQSDEGLIGKLRGKMTQNELSKIVTDLILSAGDTTAYSMEWLLYLVGKHSDIQGKLRGCLDKDRPPTSSPYLKNVIKESLRLYPVAPFLTRILPEAVVLKNYEIPAGTVLILSIYTTGRDERYFVRPKVFDPDRWERREIKSSIAQSAALPFAIGARSCIGRKLAELQLQATLAEIVKRFEFKVLNKHEVDVILKMVAVPSEELKFSFRRL